MKPALLELLDLCIASSPEATIPKEIHISRALRRPAGYTRPSPLSKLEAENIYVFLLD